MDNDESVRWTQQCRGRGERGAPARFVISHGASGHLKCVKNAKIVLESIEWAQWKLEKQTRIWP